jgi:hypothetical protein
MGDRRSCKIECLHMLGTPESERLKVTALDLWEASGLSFDMPLPGKPPNIPDRPPPFQEVGFFILRHSLQEEGLADIPVSSEPIDRIAQGLFDRAGTESQDAFCLFR